jgi:hypothetical protein
MMMQLRWKSVGAVAAMGIALLSGSSTRADPVIFTAIGTFDSGDTPGTSVYTDNARGILITFKSPLGNLVNVPPSSQASFGQFDTTGTTAATLQGVTSGFTLLIAQSDPSFGFLQFTGSLSGSLAIDNSQAAVQFDAPLVSSIGNVFYSIVSADDNVAGRVALSASTSNDGLTTVSGRVGLVPEPSSLALLGLSVPMLLACRARRRSRSAVAS